jgi:FkbM family methyltransferase
MPYLWSGELLGRKISIQLDLDENKLADQIMLHCLSTGMPYEPEESGVVMRALRPGDFVVDVGANLGFFSLMFEQLVGPTGRVLAFEPGINVLPSLETNLKLNNSSVELIKQACWHEREQKKFWLSADNSGGNGFWNPALWELNVKSQQGTQWLLVGTVLLDDFIKAAPRLIKIDTEGAEQGVLEGATSTLQRYHPPFILAEFNKFGAAQLGFSDESLRTFMAAFGYDSFLLHPSGHFPSLIRRHIPFVYEDRAVMNVLFSTLNDVEEIWKEATP